MLMKICSYFAVTADYLIGNRPSDMDDVMTEVEALGRRLMSSEALMFEGVPVEPEDIKKLIDAMQLSVRIVLGSKKPEQGG